MALTAPAAVASLDIPMQDDMRASMGVETEAHEPHPRRYIGVSGGYNASDREGVGTVSLELHVGTANLSSVGVHHRQERHNRSYGVDATRYWMPPAGASIHQGR